MPPSSREHPYRALVKGSGLPVSFSVRVAQTDLYIRAGEDLTRAALDLVMEGRARIEAWAEEDPEFLTSLSPRPPVGAAPSPVRRMLEASRIVGVGPMACVAGAMSEYVGRGLRPLSAGGVLVENGGDIYLDSKAETIIGLFAGNSPLSMKLGLKIPPDQTPVGICTSSATVGHSLSYGRADMAVVVADDAFLADGAATALGNRVSQNSDIESALEWATGLPGVRGAVVVLGDKIGFLGRLELTPL